MRTIEEIKQDIKHAVYRPTHIQLTLWAELVEAQDAEIARLRQQLEWQSMRTAPRDGTPILLDGFLDGEAPAMGYWHRNFNDWCQSHMLGTLHNPKRWRPIPPLPQLQIQEEGHE